MQYIYCNTFTAIVRGPYTGVAKMCKKCAKMANFLTSGLNYWEMVEDRWVYSTPSIVTMAVSAAILEIFNVKEWPDLEIWVWSPSRSSKKVRFDRPSMTFY